MRTMVLEYLPTHDTARSAIMPHLSREFHIFLGLPWLCMGQFIDPKEIAKKAPGNDRQTFFQRHQAPRLVLVSFKRGSHVSPKYII